MQTMPKMYSMWTEEGKALGRLCTAENKINSMGKGITTFSTPTLHNQPDGTCIERGVDGRGSWLYCVWPSYSAAMEYTPVHTEKVRSEQW